MPLYREAELSSEIAQEWLLDCRGLPEISQVVLSKILYRIAHWWSTNVDIEEYIDLLQRIYERITFKRSFDNNLLSDHFPRITITFPAEEKHISETVVRGLGNNNGAAGDTDWMECASNESNKSDYDYRYEEDPAKMIVKKMKKRKPIGGFDMGTSVNITIKEPFFYQEEVTYPELNDHRLAEVTSRSVFDQMLEIKQILPFGYTTEQLFRQIKQDIHSKIEEVRAKLRRA